MDGSGMPYSLLPFPPSLSYTFLLRYITPSLLTPSIYQPN